MVESNYKTCGVKCAKNPDNIINLHNPNKQIKGLVVYFKFSVVMVFSKVLWIVIVFAQ